MKLIGKTTRESLQVTRKPRESKYKHVVSAIAQAKEGEAIIVDLSDEKNVKSAAQRVAVAVRKCAVGVIEGKIRSRFDEASKKIFLWEDANEAAEEVTEAVTKNTPKKGANKKKNSTAEAHAS